MENLRAICVFCGSNPGKEPEYAQYARELGTFIAQSGRKLVFGGGSVGLMGIVADATLQAGGEVIGVIPDFLDRREIAHTRLTELHVVDSMHTRKKMMADLSDAFIAMPGGMGTLEELFEVLTWAQLGLHPKPIGLLNVKGYFDPLIEFCDRMVTDRFLSEEHRNILTVATTSEQMFENFADYTPPKVKIWLDKSGS